MIDVMKIIPYYSGIRRKYHSFEHVARMLVDFEKYFRYNTDYHYSLSKEEIMILERAILFHDTIHFDNSFSDVLSYEDQSILTFMEMCSDEKDMYDKISVAELIKMSQYHFEPGKLENLHRDAQIFLDLDLASFADEYSKFKHTNDLLVLEDGSSVKQIKFLENILRCDLLTFRTPEFINQNYQYRSIENIKRYIKEKEDENAQLE